MRERQDANRTREAGHLDEIQGVVANRLNAFRDGAVGFIDWLDRLDDQGLSAIWKILPFGCAGGDDIACMHNISGLCDGR